MTSEEDEWWDQWQPPTRPQPAVTLSKPPARTRFSSKSPVHVTGHRRRRWWFVALAVIVVALVAGVAVKTAAMVLVHHYTQSGTVEITIDGKQYVCAAQGTGTLSDCYQAVAP